MIDFVVPIKHTYSEKRKRTILLVALVVGGLLLFSILSGHDVLLVSSILLLVSLIQMRRSRNTDRFFIKHLKIKNEDVQIIYEDKGIEITLAGKLDRITIKKEQGFRTIYLSIYENNKLQLQQFIQGDWTESKFDEIEQYIRKFRTVGKEIG